MMKHTLIFVEGSINRIDLNGLGSFDLRITLNFVKAFCDAFHAMVFMRLAHSFIALFAITRS